MTDRSSTDLDGPVGVLRALVRAWNSGDGDAYGALFTDDASYVTFAGDVLRGAQEIGAVHGHLFAGPLRGSRLEGPGDAEVRFPAADVAVVLTGGAARPEGATDTEVAERASVQTFVLVEGADGWRVTAFHNVRRGA